MIHLFDNLTWNPKNQYSVNAGLERTRLESGS